MRLSSPIELGSAMLHIALFHFRLQSVLNYNGKLLFPIFLPTHPQTQLTIRVTWWGKWGETAIRALWPLLKQCLLKHRLLMESSPTPSHSLILFSSYHDSNFFPESCLKITSNLKDILKIHVWRRKWCSDYPHTPNPVPHVTLSQVCVLPSTLQEIAIPSLCTWFLFFITVLPCVFVMRWDDIICIPK